MVVKADVLIQTGRCTAKTVAVKMLKGNLCLNAIKLYDLIMAQAVLIFKNYRSKSSNKCKEGACEEQRLFNILYQYTSC